MEQIVELDNDLRKERECGIPRSINLPKLSELPNLPKPWHCEFWNGIPDEVLPFQLSYLRPQFMKNSSKFGSKRASILSNVSSDWEWEYYDDTEEENNDDYLYYYEE